MMRIGTVIISFILLVLLNCIEIESSSKWVYKCREQGFDPVQLACKTCTLLLDYAAAASSDTTNDNNEQYNQCIQCCSSYMDIERITKPFQSAVVVLMTSKIPTEGEVGNFFKDDWETIIELKGTTKITKIIDDSADAITRHQRELLYGGNSMFQMFGGGSFGQRSQNIAEVLFFDETLSTIKTITKMNYETMSKIAKETIPLSDMKREDMKDMIMTLLP